MTDQQNSILRYVGCRRRKSFKEAVKLSEVNQAMMQAEPHLTCFTDCRYG